MTLILEKTSEEKTELTLEEKAEECVNEIVRFISQIYDPEYTLKFSEQKKDISKENDSADLNYLLAVKNLVKLFKDNENGKETDDIINLKHCNNLRETIIKARFNPEGIMEYHTTPVEIPGLNGYEYIVTVTKRQGDKILSERNPPSARFPNAKDVAISVGVIDTSDKQGYMSRPVNLEL